ncbi:putative UPF0481 protein At3g02645 [Solanum stenotomum]|uniref:putative UPF0481 protein At3g02645 n=1 Tax=Solanum stenotomum TaxID=172797 RepID=UPI0020D18E25|nr:putative UPF0481 protein At3g02645 [Solanum stenotomum]
MAQYSIEMAPIDDDQIPLLSQTKKDEIEEGRKVDHLIDINERIDEMFEDLDNSSIKSCTIFKVNVWQRESNPDAYTPKMVSIGPYHKKNAQLDPMKKYKLLYLQRFLQRNERLDVKSYISELEKVKEKVLKCYEDIEKLGNDSLEFCEMLLFDGCFVVEFIRECYRIYAEVENEINNINHNYIFRDLMLLENQLPFFVLDKLHDMTKQDDELPLAKLVNTLFPAFVNWPTTIFESFGEIECNAENVKHLLHAVHIFSCHGMNPMKNSTDYLTSPTVMPNATELSEAGVSFAKGKNMTSLFDIKFENGLMTIPYFQVVDETETLLRNLIAYEQQSSDVPTYFTDYATFMDHLIDSDKDVNLLCQKGIIENWIGEDKEVASLFNKIGKGVTTCSNFYYKKEVKKAIEHRAKPWNRMKANLMHNYFSSPWVGASTVAAIILLVLTTIQTILTFTGPLKK